MQTDNIVVESLNQTVSVLKRLSEEYEAAVNFYVEIGPNPTEEQVKVLNQKFGTAIASYLLFDTTMKKSFETISKLDRTNKRISEHTKRYTA
jgi:hypothetical protein